MIGIRKGCIFDDLKYWHVTTNYAVDVMYDVLEGVSPFKLSLILNGLDKEKSVMLSAETVNSVLTFFFIAAWVIRTAGLEHHQFLRSFACLPQKCGVFKESTLTHWT
jgi:hypothetical protein